MFRFWVPSSTELKFYTRSRISVRILYTVVLSCISLLYLPLFQVPDWGHFCPLMRSFLPVLVSHSILLVLSYDRIPGLCLFQNSSYLPLVDIVYVNSPVILFWVFTGELDIFPSVITRAVQFTILSFWLISSVFFFYFVFLLFLPLRRFSWSPLSRH